jgi:hypothetical protein
MTSDRRPLAVSGSAALALCAALALLAAGPSLAETGSRQSAKAVFVEQRPGLPSGLTFDADYVNPSDPGGKPPAVRTVVETLAQDARFDTAVPARCDANDAQLMALGASACPPGSKVGTGYIRIDTGFPEPNRFFDVDVTFLNNTDQLIFLSTERRTGGRVVARAAIQGGRLTSMAPPLPGTPPDGGALDVVHTRLAAISREVGGVRRGYITTPSACPRGGAWTNTLSFTYSDGVTQTVASESPCTRPGARPGKGPRIHLRGVPRKRCASRGFTARVRIAASGSGLRQAILSLDGRRLLTTGRRRFTRRIDADRLKPGPHSVNVTALDRAGNRSVARSRFRSCRGDGENEARESGSLR